MSRRHHSLSHQEQRWFNQTLISSNHYQVSAEILDANRDHVANIDYEPEGGLSGQVDLDCSSQVARGGQSSGSIWSTALTAVDPKHHLGLSEGLFLNKLLRTTWSVWVPQMDDFVDCITFTGPCSAPVISGPVLSLEAQGMELRWRRAIRKARTWKRGVKVTSIIRAIAAEELGEPAKWIDIPDLDDELEDRYQAKLDITWWDAIQYLAESINCDAFPARDSTLTLRQRPTNTVYVIRDEAVVGQPQTSVLVGSPDQQGNDLSSALNRFVVIGKAKPQKPPEHGKPPKPPAITGFWNIPAHHWLSAAKLGYPGPPLWRKDVYTNDHIHTTATANKVAEQRGRRSMQLAEQATVETVMIPHVQPFQRYRVAVEGANGTWDFLKGTTPMQPGPDSPMSWGFWRDVSDQPRRHRR